MTIMINSTDELNYIDAVETNLELLFLITSILLSFLIINFIIKKVMEDYL